MNSGLGINCYRTNEEVWNDSNLAVIELRFEFFVLLDFSRSFHEVLMKHVVSFSSDREHASFSAHVSQISTVEIFGNLSNGIIIDLTVLCYGLSVDLKDVHSASFIGKADFNLSIKTTRSQKCGVKGVWSISCHNYLNLAELIETIELVQKLHQGSLDLTISAGALRETLATDSIYLIHEDDAWLVFTSVGKHFSDNSC